MSTFRTLGRGVAWNTSATVVGKIIILANVFLILANLSVYDYGLTELVLSAVAVASLFTLSGLSNVITVDLSLEKEQGNFGRMKSIFHQHLFFNSLLGIMLWLVFFVGAPLVADFAGNVSVAPLLQIVSFSFLLSPLRTASQMLATVYLRYADQSFYSVVEEIWKGGILLFFILSATLGPVELLIAVVLSQLGAVLSFAWRSLSAYRLFSHAVAEESFALLQLLRQHRKWGISSTYVNTLAQNMRLWIIKLFLNTEAVGLFAFAYGIFGNLASLLPLSTVLTPLVPRYVELRDQLVRLVKTSVKVQLALAVFALLSMLLVGPIFVSALFPKFVPAIPLLLLMSFAILPNSIVTIFTPVFAAFKAQRSLFFATVFKTIISITALPLLLAGLGLIGVAVEFVLTASLSTLERYLRMRKLLPEFKLEWRDFTTLESKEREIIRTILKRPSIARIRELLVDSG